MGRGRSSSGWVPPPTAGAQDTLWLSLAGSGLLTVPDTRRRCRRAAVLAGFLTVDNRDRDPLGLDVLDASVTLTAGLGDRPWWRSTGLGVVSRVVSVPELPPMPPPPLDLIVGPGATARPRPHYAALPDRRPTSTSAAPRGSTTGSPAT